MRRQQLGGTHFTVRWELGRCENPKRALIAKDWYLEFTFRRTTLIKIEDRLFIILLFAFFLAILMFCISNQPTVTISKCLK